MTRPFRVGLSDTPQAWETASRRGTRLPRRRGLRRVDAVAAGPDRGPEVSAQLGISASIRAIASRTREVTVVRARSAGSPARRARPPRPYAAPSSAIRNSRSRAACSDPSASPVASASASRSSSSASRARYASRAGASITSPRSPRGDGRRADQVEDMDLPVRLGEEYGEVGHPLDRREHCLASRATRRSRTTRPGGRRRSPRCRARLGSRTEHRLHLGHPFVDPCATVERERLVEQGPRSGSSPGPPRRSSISA